MQLVKIAGNTFYIPGSTNTGVFTFKDKYTLLVDSGAGNSEARKIGEVLASNTLNIKFIFSTHEHPDHWGANTYLQEHYPGSVYYASSDAALYIQNDFLFPASIYGGEPLSGLARHYVKSKKTRVDFPLSPGLHRINDEKFTIISLKGHAPGQMGLITRDQVCFLGDALFSEEILKKYGFPYLRNIQDQLDTMAAIESLECDYYVLGHAEKIYPADEIESLIHLNRNVLEECLQLCLDLMTQPKSREELLEEIIILQELTPDLHEYYLLLSTLGGIATYLHQQDQIDFQVENGRLYFFRR